MRILVTSNGETEITNIASSPTFSRNSHRNSVSPMSQTFHHSNSVTSIFRPKPPFTTSVTPFKPSLSKTKVSFYKPPPSSTTDLSKAVHISVKRPKFLLTKEMFFKYYKDEQLPKETIKRMREFRHSLKLEPTHDIAVAKHHFQAQEGMSSDISSLNKPSLSNDITVRDLFSVNAFKKFKHTVFKKEDEKKHTCNFLSPHHFRSVYQEKDQHINEMNAYLYKTIRSDRVNLIKYFKEKEVISPLSVKNLCKYDEERLLKLNKICQIALHNQENKKQFQEYVERKIGIKDRNIRLRSSKSLEDVTDGMMMSKGILSKYNHKKDNTPFLKELVHDMNDNYWKKGNIERMYKGLPAKKNSNAI